MRYSAIDPFFCFLQASQDDSVSVTVRASRPKRNTQRPPQYNANLAYWLAPEAAPGTAPGAAISLAAGDELGLAELSLRLQPATPAARTATAPITKMCLKIDSISFLPKSNSASGFRQYLCRSYLTMNGNGKSRYLSADITRYAMLVVETTAETVRTQPNENLAVVSTMSDGQIFAAYRCVSISTCGCSRRLSQAA